MLKPSNTLDQRALESVVKKAREDARMTRRELSQRLGQRQNFVSLVERGERLLWVAELSAYALAVGVEPLEMFARMLREKALYVTEKESLAAARLATSVRAKKSAKKSTRRKASP